MLTKDTILFERATDTFKNQLYKDYVYRLPKDSVMAHATVGCEGED